MSLGYAAISVNEDPRHERAYSHRIPLANLKCLSEKRRSELAARLGGEPGSARVDSADGRRSLFRPRA